MARIIFRQRPPEPRVAEESLPVMVSGGLTSLAVDTTAAWRGRREGRTGWRPINAISHILWGPRSAKHQRFTFKYTALGLLLNLIACGFWSWVYLLSGRLRAGSASHFRRVGCGIAVSALAYATDYYLVPRRLTTGFELSSTRRSLPWIYGALAIGLMMPDYWQTRRRSKR